MRRAILLVLCLLATAPLPAFARNVAVIVNKGNPVKEITLTELSKIMKLERQYWEGGKKVYLILQESGSAEKEVLLKKVYRMSDQDLKKYWLGKMFRGEISSFPKTLSSSEAIKRFISQVPNAIGVIDPVAADADVKILKVDGKRPGDEGYVLADD